MELPVITPLEGQNVRRGQQVQVVVTTRRPSIMKIQHRKRRRQDHCLLVLLHQIQVKKIPPSSKKMIKYVKIMNLTTKRMMLMMVTNHGRKGIGAYSCLPVVVARPRRSKSELNKNNSIHYKLLLPPLPKDVNNQPFVVNNIVIAARLTRLPCVLMIQTQTRIMNSIKTIPIMTTTKTINQRNQGRIKIL